MIQYLRQLARVFLALGLIMAPLSPASADPQQDYEAGVAAFDRSDLMGAMRLLRSAADVGHAGFAPHQVSVGSVSHATADGLLQTVFHAEETFLGALAKQNRTLF